MELGIVLRAPLDDADWIKKCLFAGLLMLIPIVGALIVLGWGVRYFESRRRGQALLPDPFQDIGGDLTRGFRAAVAVLGVVFPIVVVLLVFGIVGGLLGRLLGPLAVVFTLVQVLVQLVLGLAIAVIAPATISRHLTTGELWLLPQVPEMINRILGNVGSYLMLVVAVIVAQIVGNLGVIACGVGLLVTVPLGMAMQMAAYDLWGRQNRI